LGKVVFATSPTQLCRRFCPSDFERPAKLISVLPPAEKVRLQPEKAQKITKQFNFYVDIFRKFQILYKKFQGP
jgi:hypothetical protein